MSRRVAILIGSEKFASGSGLDNLGGPRNDVAALEKVLGDPARGDFQVITFLDQTRGVVMPALDEMLGAAEDKDIVLLFYAGHGKLDRNGGLCLALADTRTSALYSTSIPAAELRNLIANSQCGQFVLLLDCCFSGAVGREFARGGVDDQLALMTEAQGLHVLTASTSYQTARELEAEADGVIMGRFTRAIVDGIVTGTADRDRDGKVTLADLRGHLKETMRGQTPQYWAQEASFGDPVIARTTPLETPMQKRLRRLGGWYAEGSVPEDVYLAVANAVSGEGDAALAVRVQSLLDNPLATADALIGAWKGAIQQEERRQKAAAEARRKADQDARQKAERDAQQKADHDARRNAVGHSEPKSEDVAPISGSAGNAGQFMPVRRTAVGLAVGMVASLMAWGWPILLGLSPASSERNFFSTAIFVGSAAGLIYVLALPSVPKAMPDWLRGLCLGVICGLIDSFLGVLFVPGLAFKGFVFLMAIAGAWGLAVGLILPRLLRRVARAAT